MAGSGVGSIIMPPLMIYAIDNYGLEGTLLIMGGISLNICISAMLFRPAKFYMRRYSLKMERRHRNLEAVFGGAKTATVICFAECKKGEIDSATTMESMAAGHVCLDRDNIRDLEKKADSPPKTQPKNVHSNVISDVNETTDKRQLNGFTVMQLSVRQCQSCKDDEVNMKDESGTVQTSTNAVITDIVVAKIDKPSLNVSVIDIDYQSMNGVSLATDFSGESNMNEKQPLRVFDCSLLANPMLVIYAVSSAIVSSVYIDIFIMATPHAQLLNFSHTKSVLLVSIMGAADTVSRIAIGIFADSNAVKKHHIFHASVAISSVVLFALPSLKTYPALACACVLFAVSGGGFMAIFPTLLAEDLGLERFSTTYGMTAMLVGCAHLIVPASMGR